uniref:Uncharacterized protein n=1 Tax=Rhizophora mucronata TaxID=61149 RepID=A0A2P2P0W0_RHIMU
MADLLVYVFIFDIVQDVLLCCELAFSNFQLK